METTLLTIASIAGFLGGFFLGMFAIAHITKGHRMQEIIKNKQVRVWLGLFGWLFAISGAYIGYKLMEYRLLAP